MNIGFIFGIIGLVCGFLVFIIGLFRGKMTEVVGGIFLVVFNVFNLYMTEERNNPTALDVYRGKTTLKITYIDSTAVDSTVVFKNEKN